MSEKAFINICRRDTDKIFFDLLVTFLFKNAKKRKWNKENLKIITLEGICNADGIIDSTLFDLDNKEKYSDTVVLIYDTDAFEYQKKPPISLERVGRIASNNNCSFLSIPIEHNVEDMIVFSLKEILNFLKLPIDYRVPSGLSGLTLLKLLFKEAGKYYIKGNKSESLLRCLDYSSICKKYCKVLRPLCDYFELKCNYNLCKIRRK